MKNIKVKKFKSRSLKIKEMVKPKTIIQQEEEVSEKVSKYLCLFDESNCVKKELLVIKMKNQNIEAFFQRYY